MPGTNKTNGTLTLISGEVLELNRVVKPDSSGNAVYADAGERGIGVTETRALTSGDPVSVKLWHNDGTHLCTASEAIAINAHLYQAADGKVSDTVTAHYVGQALEAASADGAYIEVLHKSQPPMVAFTHTVTAGEASATEAVINTGLGILLNHCEFIIKTSAGVPRVADVCTFGTAGDVGKVTLGSAALAANDIIHGIAGCNAVSL